MVKLEKYSRKGRVTIHENNHINNVNVSIDGDIEFSIGSWDGRKTKHIITITGASIRDLQNGANFALSKITGLDYRTQVSIK